MYRNYSTSSQVPSSAADMQGEEDPQNNPLNRSLDDQIAEAKKRALLYSQSLKDARDKEAKAMKTLEQERDKWAHSFEQKTVMIEQLERELHSAVETLERQRPQNNHHLLSNKIPILDEQSIHQSFKQMLQPPSRPSTTPLANNYHIPQQTNSHFQHFQAPYVQPLPVPPPVTSTPAYIPHTASRTQTFNQHPNNVVAVPPPASITPQQISTNNMSLDQQEAWNELLNQYRDQLDKTKAELDKVAVEKKALTSKLVDLTNEVNRLTDDKDQLRFAHQDLETKLQFRNKQVRHT